MFKTYLEIISQEKYKRFEKENTKYLISEKYKHRLGELLKKFFTNKNSKIVNTIIIPYISSNEYSITSIDKEIIDYLNNHDYKCTEESYLLGYCINDKNKEMPITDVLKMIKQYNIEKLEQDKKDNPQYSINYDKRIKAKQNFKENYLTYYQNFNKNISKIIVFTWSPRAIASMSTSVGWESCMNLYDGQYRNKVFPTIEAGAFIAWLVQKGDEEILNNPQARILIKTYVSQNGKIFWYPSENIYGTASQEFYIKVRDFVIKKQEIHITDEDLQDVYKFDQDQYLDTNEVDELSLKNIFKERYIPILEKKLKNQTQFTLKELENYLEEAIQFNINIHLIKKILTHLKNMIPKTDQNYFDDILRYAYRHNNYNVVNVLLTDTAYNTLIDKNVLLIYAVKVNNIEVVKKLLNDGIDPSFDDNSAIEIALQKGFIDIVKLLLQDKRVKSKISENTILYTAIEYGHFDIVKFLIQEQKINPSAHNNYAILLASEKGHIEILKLLLQDPRIKPNDDMNIAFQLAAQNGHIEIVKLLLQDQWIDPSDYNNYAIQLAAKNGHTEVVKLLLQDPRIDPSDNNNYALQLAAKNGHTEIVQLLLKDPRVDPNANNNKALENAIKNKHIQIVKLLLQHKKLKLTEEDSDFILLATDTEQIDVIKLLLQNENLHPEYNDNYALEVAISKGNIDIVKLLLQDKRVLSIINNNKLNDYIHMAKSDNFTQIVNLLKQYKKIIQQHK